MALVCKRVVQKSVIPNVTGGLIFHTCARRFNEGQYCPPNMARHPQCAECKSDYCRFCVGELGIQEICRSCRNWMGFSCQSEVCKGKKAEPQRCSECHEMTCGGPECILSTLVCVCCDEAKKSFTPIQSASITPIQSVSNVWTRDEVVPPSNARCYCCQVTRPLSKCVDLQCTQF